METSMQPIVQPPSFKPPHQNRHLKPVRTWLVRLVRRTEEQRGGRGVRGGHPQMQSDRREHLQEDRADPGRRVLVQSDSGAAEQLHGRQQGRAVQPTQIDHLQPHPERGLQFQPVHRPVEGTDLDRQRLRVPGHQESNELHGAIEAAGVPRDVQLLL